MVVENVVSDDHVWVGFLCRGVFVKSSEMGGQKRSFLGHKRSF